jgi:amino acid permease
MSLDVKNYSTDKSRYGLFTGYVFTINCIIGTGFLSIPYAFDNSGIIFGFLYQLVVGIQGYAISRIFLECMSRAEVLLRTIETGEKINYAPFRKAFFRPAAQNFLDESTESHLMVADIPSGFIPIITKRVITIQEVMRLTFGETFGKVYFYLLFFDFIGTLITYCSIFSTSFASNVPLGAEETCDIYSTNNFYNDCRVKYWIYLLIFFIVTCFLTVKGTKEQRLFQALMSMLRFTVIFLVIGTSLANIFLHKNNEDDGYNPINTPKLFVPKNIGHSVPIIIFASSYITMIPTLFEPIGNKPRNLPLICFFVSLTTIVLYSLLGLILPLAVNDIQSMGSLAYRNYSAGYSQSARPSWTYFIEYLIILCPAVDVLSAFPLNALVFADVITAELHRQQKRPKSWKYTFRFVIAFFPAVVAFFVYDLSFIFDWTGLAGFFTVYVCVPLAHNGLRHTVPGKSVYDFDLHPIFFWIIILSNIGLFFVVIILNALDY